MPPSVLVPLDGSAAAETVLVTLDAVLGADAERHLVRVVPAPPRRLFLDPSRAVRRADPDPEVLEVARARLQQAVDDQRASGHTAEPHLLAGAPASTVVRLARELGVDTIALTHDPARPVLGSVTAEVVRTAPTPTLVITPPRAFSDPPSRVLVALDGQPHDAVALAAGRDLALHHGAMLELVRVLTLDFDPEVVELDGLPPDDDEGSDSIFARLGRRDRRDRIVGALSMLERHTRDLDAAALQVHTTLLEGPVDAGLRHAGQRSPGAPLVVATRPHHGLALGSVTGELLRTLDRPLIVARGEAP